MIQPEPGRPRLMKCARVLTTLAILNCSYADHSCPEWQRRSAHQRRRAPDASSNDCSRWRNLHAGRYRHVVGADPTLPPGTPVSTIEAKINYLLPVRTGELESRGAIIHQGRSTAVLESTVFKHQWRGTNSRRNVYWEVLIFPGAKVSLTYRKRSFLIALDIEQP